MGLKIIVLAKQVPDTRNVGKDAMTAEGTVNRAALPAIFNPEDLNALEQALRLKDQNPGSTVGILTMGPPRAAEIIRQGLYRGADTGWLLTDRLFAGADTLATSYALATAIQKIGGTPKSKYTGREKEGSYVRGWMEANFIGVIEQMPGDTIRMGRERYVIPTICCKRCGCKDCRFYLVRTAKGKTIVHKHQIIGKAYKLF